MNLNRTFDLAVFAAALLAAVGCGGGGGGTSPSPSVSTTTPPSGGTTPTPTSTASTGSGNVAGTVVQIPSDAYGPATIAGVTYQSADITTTTPLVGAMVIIGPVPIVGATAPATLPTGDVSATTNASGAFSASVSVAPAAPATSEPFLIPADNLTGFTPPATGYYIQVFGASADGQTAGTLLPLHRFVASGTSIALHVSTISAAEAGALVAVNSDRATNGAGALTFDEQAEEAARLHANDMAAQGYLCHYDTHNVGPASRYLQAGAIGLTGESLEDDIAANATVAFQVAESTFMAEKTQSPPGSHYTNNVDVAHLWAGLAAVPSAVFGGNFVVDYELVTPSGQDAVAGATGYTNAGLCPPGTAVNNS
jgi:uncharacterized protein YkwD